MPKGKGQGSVKTQFSKGKRPTGQEFKEGQIPWNKGIKGVIKVSDETRARLSLAQMGKIRLSQRRRIIKKCLRCGKEFETGGRVGKATKVYCSNRCSKMTQNGNVMANGYRCVRLDGKRIYEHRLVAEKTLSRPLKRNEIVHHNNFNKTDNRPENLTVMSQACHRALIDYLASLWVKEHVDLVDKITREYAEG